MAGMESEQNHQQTLTFQILPDDLVILDQTSLTQSGLKDSNELVICPVKTIEKQPQLSLESQKLNLRYRCDLCSVTCSTAGNLERHRKIHTVTSDDDGKYTCETCSRQFHQQCDLRRHRLIHTNSHPHRCQHCQRGFLRENDLKKHILFHMKIKPYSCQHCDKSFVQKGDLLRHVKGVHLKQAKLACTHCSRKYSTETTLMRHMQTAHRDILLQASQGLLENVANISQNTDLVASTEKQNLGDTTPSETE